MPSPTYFPTLESTAKLNFIVNMLETNGGCELPCWWGVVPGKTSWEEMKNYFAAQGIGFEQDGQLDLSYDDPTTTYRDPTLDVEFQQEDGVVQHVLIKTAYFYLFAQPEYSHNWQEYALPQMLSRFGTPSQVYLELTIGAADWTPGMKQYFNLWLVYDVQGIAIRYPGQLIRDNRGWFLCPVSNFVYGLEIRLQTPNANTPVVSIESGEGGYGDFSGTLVELTGVTVQEFRETFSQFPPHGCLLISDPSPWWYDEIVSPSSSIPISPEHEDGILVDMLASNAGCELPCWWGIRPGETTTQNAQRVFLSLGKSVASRRTNDLGTLYMASLFGRHSPYPFDYVVEHRFYERDNVVYLLGVTGYSLGWSPPQHFSQDWQRYSLDQVLTRFGQPSQVLLHYWGFGWQYSIGLVYEDKGVLIQYVGPISGERSYLSEEPVAICVIQDRPTAISMWLTRPDSGIRIADAFTQFGYVYPDDHPFSHVLTLEEGVGMNVKTFYETYLNPAAQVCLKAPRNLGDLAP